MGKNTGYCSVFRFFPPRQPKCDDGRKRPRKPKYQCGHLGAIGKLNLSPSCNNRGINLGDSMEESISSNAADAGEVKENETKKERPTSLDLDKCDAGNDEEVKIQDGKKSSTTRLPAQI